LLVLLRLMLMHNSRCSYQYWQELQRLLRFLACPPLAAGRAVLRGAVRARAGAVHLHSSAGKRCLRRGVVRPGCPRGYRCPWTLVLSLPAPADTIQSVFKN
jgi:hypothetical protein